MTLPDADLGVEIDQFGFAGDQSTSILAGELDVNVSVQGVFAIAP